LRIIVFLVWLRARHNRWNGASLSSFLDVAVGVVCPFVDWYLHGQYLNQGTLGTGQIITLSMLNLYMTLRFFAKTTATAGRQSSKEPVERVHFIWMVRTARMARQIFPEINATYGSLVEECELSFLALRII